MNTARRPPLSRLLLSAALVALCGFAGCGRESSTAPDAESPSQGTANAWAAPPDDYVGSAACAECHADTAAQFASHPMARSLAHALAASPVGEDEEATEFASGSRRYRVERTPGAIVHHEILNSPSGETLYDYAAEVAWAVGSGERGRSYLIEQDGCLCMSSLTWYAGGARWDLSPGYDVEEHRGFERRVSDGCLQCHSGRVHRLPAGPHRYESPAFIEEAIGCERCHGPGGRHVAFHKEARSGVDPIVNPVDLAPRERESVCNQCHLHGIERVLRPGRSDFDFRPGDDLADVWAVFVESNPGSDRDRKAVSQVEQMRLSRCYVGSEGRLGCISCHDPHAIPAPENRIRFYRDRCLACHQGEEHQRQSQTTCGFALDARLAVSPEDSCIACHMPALAASDVPHTAQTDHRIVRTPSGAGVTGAGPTGAGPTGDAVGADQPILFDHAERRLPADEQRRAWGMLLARRVDQGDTQSAGKALEYLLPLIGSHNITPDSIRPSDDDLPLLEAAVVALRTTDTASQARALAEQALARHPRSESLLESLVIVCAMIGDPAAGIDYAQRYLELCPWNSTMHGRLAILLEQQGEAAAALEAARHGLEVNPSSVPLRTIHQRLARAAGDAEAADRDRAVLDALRPMP